MAISLGHAFTVLAACQVLAGAAMAGGDMWDCTIASRCVSGESCFDIATPAKLTLSVATDGKSVASASPGETLKMRLIDAQTGSRTFFQRVGSGTIGFMTLYSDGTLLLSSHDASGGDVAATASQGTCTRVEN